MWKYIFQWNLIPKITGFKNSHQTYAWGVIVVCAKSIELDCKSLDWFLYDRNLRHEGVNIASFIVRWSEMIKNYTNLIYANQLKTQICRSIINMIQKQKTQ